MILMVSLLGLRSLDGPLDAFPTPLLVFSLLMSPTMCHDIDIDSDE